MKRIAFLPFVFFIGSLHAQTSSHIIHSHNDYAAAEPFYGAYRENVGSIEADVFEKDEALLVGHTRIELSKDRTLASLYLEPLVKEIKNHSGNVFSDGHILNLLIDLKTDGDKTLTALVKTLEDFPEIIECSTHQITVSGNVPDTCQWKNYPAYIHFDGRPTVKYSPKHLARVTLISDNLKNYTAWTGSKPLEKNDREKLSAVIKYVHDQGKKIRFWTSNDNPVVWKELLSLQVDYIGTDSVHDVAAFLRDNFTRSR